MIGTNAAGGTGTGTARLGRAVVLMLPGLWILSVVAWELFSPYGTEAAQLLVAVPAIACAGSGSRRCVVTGGVTAVCVLIPLTAGGTRGLGTLLGGCGAIAAVLAASYLASGRGVRLARELDRARAVATAAQDVVLRPLPARLDSMTLAGGHLSATRGAALGGDLYEAVATAHGVRVVMGDVRGHGLAAIGTVAAVLGSFREAAHDEPELPDVLRRLDRALQRHLRDRARAAHPAGRGDEPHSPLAEEFVTVLLLELRPDGEVIALNCGHPWPYRLTAAPADGPAARQLAPDGVLPPLGLFPLPADLPPVPCGRLRHGDALVLHTDGAEDARDRDGAFFPLGAALNRAARHPAIVPSDVVAEIQRGVLAHTGGRLADDIALLVLCHDRPEAPTPSTPSTACAVHSSHGV
ncbi:PP2C family protein-serine/threonine phosphatase [Streptomyces sp. XD-27]|uniref:PP2C family protein-serine/threonine phosphatase n=1 Tax=Streptomyces sp. XD-27 TaxID=3062779 RepID=UPI0026F4633A|nr:PP2C family protein-serine/threonine phosphatase [Streptomyces sp. XD-27]WKX73371.1 PP2C family protein-serine/threonine phosphatase [Streptomyces sp. XD-27]